MTRERKFKKGMRVEVSFNYSRTTHKFLGECVEKVKGTVVRYMKNGLFVIKLDDGTEAIRRECVNEDAIKIIEAGF